MVHCHYSRRVGFCQERMVKMSDQKKAVPVEWREQRVLTNKQLSEYYGCSIDTLKHNFRRAKKYFVKGVDYFKLEGEELQSLKDTVENDLMSIEGTEFHQQGRYYSPVATANCSLVLYTKQGAARHCKMINTQKAWDMFNLLMDNYFKPAAEVVAVEVPASPVESEQKPVDKLKEEISMLKNQLSKINCTEFAVVYILLMSNGSVKIGMTKDLTERIKQLKHEKRLETLDFYTTSFMSRLEALRLEQTLHQKYAEFNLGGEFYNIRFVDVVSDLKALCA